MIEPIKIQVRFADIDVMGHVNNAVYLSYFEITRMHYFKQMVAQDWDWNKDGIILLKNEIEYKRPVLLTDSPTIEMNVDHIGNKSFTLSYKLMVNGNLCCTGKSVIVGYDNSAHKTIPIPLKMKEELIKLQKEQ